MVCADALRTPQLLFASGIRPEALGRYLNEHAFVTGRVLMDLDRFGLALADSAAAPSRRVLRPTRCGCRRTGPASRSTGRS